MTDATTARGLAESIAPPWVVWNDEADELIERVFWATDARNRNLSIRWLDGAQNADQTMSELRAALQFPRYFGRNWSAVIDCLRDLDWDNRRSYLIAIRRAEHVLADDEPESLKHFLDIFTWLSPEFTEEYPWSFDQIRPPTPFHLLLHVSAEQREPWQSRLQDAGLDIPWMPARNPISWP